MTAERFEIGRNIVRASFEGLARYLGISTVTCHKYASGKASIPDEIAEKLAHAVNNGLPEEFVRKKRTPAEFKADKIEEMQTGIKKERRGRF